MSNIVEAIDVVKDYTNHRALDHVSVSVPRGQIFGLLGPNGAGKTTLIRILNRITAPDSGKILFDGREFVPQDLENIGYLPEERGLYQKMKVGDQAIYLAQLKGLSKQESTERLTVWFEKFGIMPWWNKKIEELSKGMAQKVQFITTIIHRPKLLIFDEPFSGFDPINADQLKAEILNLRDEGHSVIFSTHNMQSVEEICDNIALINHSKVILRGNVREIRESYKGNRFRVEYDSTVDIPEEFRHRYLPEEITQDAIGNYSFTITNQSHLPNNEVIKDASSLGSLTLFSEIIPSMHEIFVEAVSKSNASDSVESHEHE